MMITVVAANMTTIIDGQSRYKVRYWQGPDSLLIYSASQEGGFPPQMLIADHALRWNPDERSFRLMKNRSTGINHSGAAAQAILLLHFRLKTRATDEVAILDDYDGSSKAAFHMRLKYGLDLGEC